MNKNFEEKEICGEAFNTITGKQMYSMTEQDFINKDPGHGKLFFEEFQSLMKGKPFPVYIFIYVSIRFCM